MREQMARRSPKQKRGTHDGTSVHPKTPDQDDDNGGVEFRREIGERLKVTRKALRALGIGPRWQKDFATSIGLPGSTYNQVESGKQILSPAQAARLYQRYGISLNWIYLGVIDDLATKLVDAIEAEKANPSK